ncbi:TlpA disulfide reductase family protein [Afifella sp. IM 167]|uniref:TlpA family protein disulfide reductase n=1 Tax=Afifella sp. IM 167 TaxID=2033586 RepID=UPI001CCC3F53|nr:TlpA disulfide reductase family protein [Afifella sp. IM 167]MBZ8134570.1 hypothetical protein [Afifella sp. IM 167]
MKFLRSLRTVTLALTLVAGVAAAQEAAPDTSSLLVAAGEGEPLSLAETMPEGPVILHFWATWCAPCRTELPAVERFSQELARMGGEERLLVISVDRADHDRVAAFLREGLGITHLTAWQVRGGNPGSAFRILGYPATIVLAGDGHVAKRIAGPADWDGGAFRKEILALLNLGD